VPKTRDQPTKTGDEVSQLGTVQLSFLGERPNGGERWRLVPIISASGLLVLVDDEDGDFSRQNNVETGRR